MNPKLRIAWMEPRDKTCEQRQEAKEVFYCVKVNKNGKVFSRIKNFITWHSCENNPFVYWLVNTQALFVGVI